MIMEAFEGIPEGQIVYDIVGHSGESAEISFVREGAPPKNEADRLKVLRAMHAHSQFCYSGDHTLQATRKAIDAMSAREDSDERYVIVLSDANLERYGIHPRELGSILAMAPGLETKAFCIMIGSLGEQARRLQQGLPNGTGYVCMDTSELPKIIKQILTAMI